MSLEGKSVVVTGGAGGIGLRIARACAQRGAHVTLGDVSEEKLASIESEFRSLGYSVVVQHCDVRLEDDAHQLMETAASFGGTVDYLINAAGIVPETDTSAVWSVLRDVEYSFWNEVFDTNNRGMFLCSKHAIPYMERQRSGHIVNVHCTIGGEVPAQFASYVMSTNVSTIFTRFLAAQEREFNICVMAIPTQLELGWNAQLVMDEFSEAAYLLAADVDMSLSGRVVGLVSSGLVPLDLQRHHETLPEGTRQELTAS